MRSQDPVMRPGDRAAVGADDETDDQRQLNRDLEDAGQDWPL
ncbi:hypothetical protein [Streptomyces cacaoi]|nr:hypothetical protein [Streptomyces cacaoi]